MTSAAVEISKHDAPQQPRDSKREMIEILGRMKKAGLGKPPPSYEERVAKLDRLEATLLKRKGAIVDAVQRDFGSRSRHETLLTEVYMTVAGIKHARARLRDWMDPKEREVTWPLLPSTARIMYQPLGVVGVISPWNYPVQLALAPLVSALAAGNRVMVKPSELVPHTSDLLAELLAETFQPDEVATIIGGADVGEAFARLPFDHLVFTGSARVGKLVMKAAAENLTPVTLELGGKSPFILADDFPHDAAATRIMAGKTFNAGQTCVAPDYAFIPERRRAAFVEACKAAVAKLYPTLLSNPDYTSIISDRHYDRLSALLEDARTKGAQIVELNPSGEVLDARSRKMAPTLVFDVSDDMSVMQEEIFGPILPVREYRTLDEALAYVNGRPRPLALYVFTYDRAISERVLTETISGGVTINETMFHAAQEDLPLGGVGASGMGHYRAFEGFERFSKKKPVFEQSRIYTSALVHPPYGKALDWFLRLTLGR